MKPYLKRYIIMGVAGCGKSTIGADVANRLGGQYIDGDDLHPTSNIEKMSRGEPLNDEDRTPWLNQIGKMLKGSNALTFIGCSALKKQYREQIRTVAKNLICFIYLKGSKQLISERMASREGHFMPTALLDSQFAILEEPQNDECHIDVDISQSLDKVVEDICINITQFEEIE